MRFFSREGMEGVTIELNLTEEREKREKEAGVRAPAGIYIGASENRSSILVKIFVSH